MTPGPELDLAVAKACGLTNALIAGHDCFLSKDSARRNRSPFRPSTDINDALIAASEVRLFEKMDLWHDATQHLWCVGRGTDHYTEAEEVTTALAICAAILKVAGD